jgi:xanthine dehydrogenase accessory factor
MGAFDELYGTLTEGNAAALLTVIESSTQSLPSGEKLVLSGRRLVWSRLERGLAEKVLTGVLPAAGEIQTGLGTAELESGIRVRFFLQHFHRIPRLIILGGGHVGAALSRLAEVLDYEIVLVDDRPFFASRERHPQAHRVICSSFEAALDELPASLSDYIVIVTRGHRHDRLCLEKSLGRPAAYIGMIGSRRRVSGLIKELAADGFAREELSKVHAPIGLKIGAVTEGEIALSILAEITAVRRSADRQEPAQEEVLRELVELERRGGYAVLATITKAYGSTPRKAGTRMLIFADGQISGTVGGGCAEAEVRREALSLTGRAEPKTFILNLTADAAAEEGMACGGKMELFLEPLVIASGN